MMRRGMGLLIGCLAASAASPVVAAGDASMTPSAVRWIWHPEGTPSVNAPEGHRYFRGRIDLPADRKILCAHAIFTADDTGVLFANGAPAARKSTGWTDFETVDVTRFLKPGPNVLAVDVMNHASAAGLIGWLAVRFENGVRVMAVTDGSWKSSDREAAGWTKTDFDDGTWPSVRVIGPADTPPWAGRMVRVRMPLMTLTARRGTDPVAPALAKTLIEEDWMFQAGDRVTAGQARQEIGWARELAARLSVMERGPDFHAEKAELDHLESRLAALPPDRDDEAALQLYLSVRRVKRSIQFRNPLIDFDRLLLVDGPDYAGAHESAHRNGYHYGARAGSRLLVLEGLRPDGVERELVPGEAGYVMRMDLSFEADRVVYALKPKEDRSFHLYETNLDGTGRRQLTDSPYDDMDPIYLPDGHILFSTSRGNSYVRCLPQSASTVLARCDPDGKNIYIVSRNNEPDYTPSLMEDGRVLYTRWEYTERPLWRLQKLWTINPDGTGEAVFWGNGSAHPDMLWEARAVPGGRGRVMFAAVGHHNVITGCLGLIDPAEGLQWPDGIRKITQELPWPEVGEPAGGSPGASSRYHASGGLWSARCPYPLGPEDFLVSAARSPNGEFSVFLMDIHGNRELIYTGRGTAWYPQPVRPRARPPLIPDRVNWPAAGAVAEGGVLFSPNVCDGVDGLAPGQVKFLRVIEMDAKTYSMGFKSWRHSGPAISVIQEDGVKRILGTVPVEADGSVAFKAPSGKALHFQLLDDRQRCLQVMRSFTGVMPGETRGCLGCHSLHSAAPPAAASAALALRRPPSDLAPPPWGSGVSVSYERFCQPVLDKHCGACHQGDGKGRAALDLTLRGGVPEGGISDPALLPFKEPYLTLVGPAWGGPKPEGKGAALGLAGCLNVEAHHQYGPLKPMTMLSSTSRLIDLVTSGKHHGVKVEGEDLLKLIAWVDCNCVYRGDEEVRRIPDPEPRASSAFPVPVKTATAPRIDRLQPVSDPIRGRAESGP